MHRTHDDPHQQSHAALDAWKPAGFAATKELWSGWTENQHSAYVHWNPDGFTSGWLNADQLNCYGEGDSVACNNIGISTTPQRSQEDVNTVYTDVAKMWVQTGKPVAGHDKKHG